MADKISCISCGHLIDAVARLCPYCGANPQTGEKFDPTPMVQSHFPPKPELPAHETILEFLRARQSIVLTLVIVGVLLIAVAMHQMIIRRNLTVVSDVPPIPLTEVADLSNQPAASEELPMPELEFESEGQVRNVRTLLLEPGAVPPPPPAPSPSPSPSPPGSSPNPPGSSPNPPGL